MFFKVITVSLITICTADSRMLLPEPNVSDQERPAVRINGHVLFPTIYKYARVNPYSTLNSILRPVRSVPPNISPNIFRKLQYAPLHEGDSLKNKIAQYITPTPSSGPWETTDSFLNKKNTQLYPHSHLEPRRVTTDTKCYAPGYKVEAVETVSRSPGHNAVYRTISEETDIEKPDKISDYSKPIGINLKLDLLTTTLKPSLQLPSEHLVRPLTLTNEHFVINPDIVESIAPEQDKSKRYTPHTKFHRLHLNIARVYSPGQVPPKPAVFPNEPGNYGRPPHPHLYVPQAYPELNLNTMLYPVKRHRKGYRFRSSIIHL